MANPRRQVLALGGLGLTLALAACGGSGTGGGENASGNGGTDGSSELTVWHYFSADNQVALMDAYADMFEASHDGVTVNNVYQPYDQLNSKVIAAAGAGEGPDVIVFNGAEWSTLALAGALAPMDEYWAAFDDAGQFSDAVVHGMDDHTYAVQGYVNLLGLWYNADLLDELGVQPPTTMDELEAAMAATTQAGYEGITLSGLPQSQGEWQAYPWLTSAGFTYENLDEQALADAFARARSWVDQGYLSQEAVTWDQTVPFQEFTAGGVAFAENGNWQIGTAESDAGFSYGVVPLPLGPDGQVYLGGEGEAIGAHSQNPDLAWEYLAETYYSSAGELKAQELVGSIPARTDASQQSAGDHGELLAPFAQTLNDMGASYPAANIPPEAVADVQSTMGEAWSAVLSGQQTPEDAAAQAVARLQDLIG